MHTTVALISAALVLTGPPASRAPSVIRPGVELANCIVSLIDDIPVPAEVAGMLVAMDVKEGDYVEAAQRLAQIDDVQAQLQLTAAQAELEAAKAKADDDINVRFATAARDVADAGLKMSENVNRRERGAVSESQLKAERLALTKATLQIEVAELEWKVAGLTANVNQARVDAAQQEIKRCAITARLPGKIEQVMKHVGEWVNPGDPVLRLVRLDRLRVEGFMNAAVLSPARIAGRPVRIEVNLYDRKVEFAGAINFVGALIEASGEYRVWAEVENRQENGHWVLLDGLSAKMTVLDSR